MKKVLAMILVLLMLTAALPLTAYAADGYVEDDDQEPDIEMYRFIYVYEYDEENPDHDAADIYSDGAVHNDALEGVTYDIETNTLTLDNYNYPMNSLYLGSMGESFKLVVKGECALSYITCTMYGDECWIDIEGDGILTVNECRKAMNAIWFISMFNTKSRLNFGEDVKVRMYGNPENEDIIVAMYYTGFDNADDAIIFNGSHNLDAEYTEEYNKEPVWFNACYEDNPGGMPEDFLGYVVFNSDDPQGIYTANYFTLQNTEGEITGDGYIIYRWSWCEQLQVYLPIEFDNVPYTTTTLEMTVEEFENSPYEWVLDEYEDCIPLSNYSSVKYEEGLFVYEDKGGNRYAVQQDYDWELEEFYYRAATFEPIEGMEGKYLFTYADIDTATLEEIPGMAPIRGYFVSEIEGFRYLFGNRVINPDDPDGLYIMDKVEIWDFEGNVENYCDIYKYVYDEETGCYLRAPEYLCRFTPEEFRASDYVLCEDSELYNDKDIWYSDWIMLYTDNDGNDYGMINYNGEEYFYTRREIDGLDGLYWLTPAEVDPEELTQAMQDGDELIKAVVIKGDVLEYNLDGGVVADDHMLGDADGDGEVSILDATAIQRHLAELPTKSYLESAADADGDGEVSILDATAIQRYLAELPTNENIGKYF